MKKAILTKFIGRVWCVAQLELFNEAGILEEIIKINRFFKVTDDWVNIYAADGGCDSVYQGDLIQKVYIGDREFKLIKAHELVNIC